MAKPKKPTGFRNAGDQARATGVPIPTNQPKVETRPTGTPKSENIDITSLDPEARAKLQQSSGLQGQEIAKLTMGAERARARNLVLEREAQRQGLEAPQATDIPTTTDLFANNPATEMPGLGEVIASDKQKQLTGQGTLPVSDMSPTERIPMAIAGTKAQVANFVDFVRVGVTGKKPLKVSQAEASLTDGLSAVNQNIKAVREGILDYHEAIDSLERTAAAINRLERSQKGLGKENLRYWSDEGKEVEAEIINAKERIDQMRTELLVAAQEGRLAQAQATFGQ